MENTNTEIVVEQKSTILSEEQVATITSGEEVVIAKGEEIVLPSEEGKDALPEKYSGKSAEEVYKLMMVEKEYKDGKEESTEETSTVSEEGTKEVPTDIIKEFTDKLIENGGEFTEDNYAELAAKGYSKDFVDNYKTGVEAKQMEAVNKTFSEAGTTQADYAEAGKAVREIWGDERSTEYNDAINNAVANGDVATQKALIRSMMDAVNAAPKPTETFHTNNTPKSPRVEGYSTKSDYFADVNNSRYSKDTSYRELVEKKFLKTNRTNW